LKLVPSEVCPKPATVAAYPLKVSPASAFDGSETGWIPTEIVHEISLNFNTPFLGYSYEVVHIIRTLIKIWEF
jgi:hypothetical protein